MGASYVMTGSINQAAVEAGTSDFEILDFLGFLTSWFIVAIYSLTSMRNSIGTAC